jgi:Holliday junction resolvasome RuvABC DNA-binding subunit
VGEPTGIHRNVDEQQIADVQAGLVRLGFRRDEARAAVARAHAQVGRGADIETLLRAALRECPRTS